MAFAFDINDDDQIAEIIERVAEDAPRISRVMRTLLDCRASLAEYDNNELVNEALDMRRSHLACFFSLIHAAHGEINEVIVLGSDNAEWPVSPDDLMTYCRTVNAADDALEAVVAGLMQIPERHR
ncbi:hypothetical protein ACQP1W_52400 (plasmid) [Spirillospora sp. CA-255316]